MPEIEPEVTYSGFLDMQVCVPTDWTDEQVLEFAETKFSCGTRNGWTIRKEYDKAHVDALERNPCRDRDREGYVHIMLDA